MKRFAAMMIGISLALGTAVLPVSADDKSKETTTVKGKDVKETTKVKEDDNSYKATTKTKRRHGRTTTAKTKVKNDDGKIKVEHEEKTK